MNYKNIFSTSIAVFFSLLMGCASTPSTSSEKRISIVGTSMKNTLEQLNKTHNTFSDFQKKIGEIQEEANDKEGMRQLERYKRILSHLNTEIQQSKVDMSRLYNEAKTAQSTYQNQLESAANNIEQAATDGFPGPPDSMNNSTPKRSSSE